MEKQQPVKPVALGEVSEEKILMYKNRRICSAHNAYLLIKEFLGDVDREHSMVICLDTRNQQTCI
ncbi:MPN domain-containing protein [Ureibacillus manganicus]|uniref:hypothetical protein n=1 Tax=Ureibacillus manganicus TaxID=1266064 RepID=UPI00068EB4A5|nr:hypothetical protein [Ureibacillus manganicus]